jgi:hypothetical protein
MLLRFLALTLLLVQSSSAVARTEDDAESTSEEEVLRAAHLPTEGAALLIVFRERTPDETSRHSIIALIRQLGSDSFAVREQASEKLSALGVRAAGLLREASHHKDLEIRWRARQALADVVRRDVSVEALTAALRTLGRHKLPRTAEVVLAYLPYAEDGSVAEEIQHVLTSLAVREGKPNPVLVRALSDHVAVKRGAAGVALCQAGCMEQMAAIRRLLRDDDPNVRRRVALALVEAREKAAVPVLIELLTQLPSEEVERVESVLVQLAGEAAPSGNAEEPAARVNYRDAWMGWWTRHGEALDLSHMDLSQKWLGRTLAVCFGANPRAGCILELDAHGKTRWQMPGLLFPIDAQIIDERRILVTEYRPGQVTERNHKGEILRRIDCPDFPLEARRLPNGNTFITTRYRVFEVDRNGKQVWESSGDRGGIIVAACPLRGGEVGIYYRTGEFTRMDRNGKVLASFRVGRLCRPYGTHVQALPNGHILVPLYYDNKVVEYDRDGNEVWSASYPRPTSAQRLPNGRTLVAGYGANVIAEIDTRGKEVKSVRCEGRIMCVQGR